MARLITAVLVWAVAVVLALGVGGLLTAAQQQESLIFAVPPVPLRIVLKGSDPELCLTVGPYHNIVLRPRDDTDENQKWESDFASYGSLKGDDNCRKPFALVNRFYAPTSSPFTGPDFEGWVLLISSLQNNIQQVKLAPYSKTCQPVSTLWTEDPASDRSWYQIRALKDPGLALYGPGYQDSEVGVSYAARDNANTQWVVQPFYRPYR
ncbi:hypothetical protein ACP70R_021191 [Stipagrostis hirtigluma subsp. patula]